MSHRELKGLGNNSIVQGRLHSENSQDNIELLEEFVPSVTSMIVMEKDQQKMEELQAELERVRG